ncbi:hypothetical protein [Microcoleus sp. S13C4]|uniref:hypothetical protein n=1 Tax=Microcoleus sp. S13C4 TaxID=3055410 RepID=UPI002FD0AF6E
MTPYEQGEHIATQFYADCGEGGQAVNICNAVKQWDGTMGQFNPPQALTQCYQKYNQLIGNAEINRGFYNKMRSICHLD